MEFSLTRVPHHVILSGWSSHQCLVASFWVTIQEVVMTLRVNFLVVMRNNRDSHFGGFAMLRHILPSNFAGF